MHAIKKLRNSFRLIVVPDAGPEAYPNSFQNYLLKFFLGGI
jgi:hypothetical protein